MQGNKPTTDTSKLEAELIKKYLEAGGDPDYIVVTPKGYELPPNTDMIVMSRKDFERAAS